MRNNRFVKSIAFIIAVVFCLCSCAQKENDKLKEAYEAVASANKTTDKQISLPFETGFSSETTTTTTKAATTPPKSTTTTTTQAQSNDSDNLYDCMSALADAFETWLLYRDYYDNEIYIAFPSSSDGYIGEIKEGYFFSPYGCDVYDDGNRYWGGTLYYCSDEEGWWEDGSFIWSYYINAKTYQIYNYSEFREHVIGFAPGS